MNRQSVGEIAADGLLVLGAGAILVGIHAFSVAAARIVAGAMLVYLGIALARGGAK